MTDLGRIWKVMSNARSNCNIMFYCACHINMNLVIDPSAHMQSSFIMPGATRVIPPTCTKYCACHEIFYDWSQSQMKRYLQGAEQRMSSSNITEYCACQATWRPKISQKFLQKQMKRHLQWATDPTMIRDRSENETVIPNPPRKRGYFSCPPQPFYID